VDLREKGIYCLPNGRELVVLEKLSGGHVKFRLGVWESFQSSQYEVNNEGRLLALGRVTAWDITDLSDTGRTANIVPYTK
jgi:hypothetical protein